MPLGSWLRRELRGLPAELMLDPAAATSGISGSQSVRRLIGEHETGVVDHSMRLWTLMMLEMWHQEVLTGAHAAARRRRAARANHEAVRSGESRNASPTLAAAAPPS